MDDGYGSDLSRECESGWQLRKKDFNTKARRHEGRGVQRERERGKC
jgi:hypothetical protein